MNSRRYQIEANEMTRRFPFFKPIKFKNGTIGWRGKVNTRFGNVYEILVQYPNGYPNAAPKIFSSTPLLPMVPHRYDEGNLCTHLPDEWSPNMTATTSVGWASAWFHAYDVWRRSGRWPGRTH